MSLYCSSCGVANTIDASNCKSCSAKLLRSNDSNPIEAEVVDSKSENGLPTGVLFSIVIAVVCLIYIVNPTAGFVEFIPDNLPIIGNLDEATATSGLLYALSNLGLIPWTRKQN